MIGIIIYILIGQFLFTLAAFKLAEDQFYDYEIAPTQAYIVGNILFLLFWPIILSWSIGSLILSRYR